MAQVSAGKGVEGLDGICQSPEYRAWVLQFTAHHYIGQDTQAFRARVREAVAAGAPALDNEKLSLLQDAVIDRLTGAAEAVSTRASGDQKATDHTRHAIEDLVTLQFPLPIAVCYQKLAEIEDGGGAFSLLLDAFESLVHMLFTIALSAYWRDTIPSPKLNETLLTFFGAGKWPLGHIMDALQETARTYRQRSDRLLCPELVDTLFTTSGGQSRVMDLLRSLGTLRNKGLGHGWQRDDQRLAPLALDNRPLLDEALSRCGWLRNYSLWVPRVIDANGLVTSIDVLRGVRRQKDRKTSFQLEGKDLDINGGDIKLERTLLLVNEERAAYLPLFPLSLSHVQRQSVRSFFLRELKWKQRCEFLELAHYETFESGEGGDKREYRVRRLEDAVTKLEAKVRDLTNALKSQAKVLAEINEPVAEQLPDLDLPRVRSEQELHLKNFAGRAGSLTALAEWAGRVDAGGYLVVLGPPGQGKSAVLAQFAHQEAGCIFHMVKSERNPQRFLQFLIWQCAQQLQEALPESSYLGDVPHLIDVLFRSLARLRERHGRVLLILDALDADQPDRGLACQARERHSRPPLVPAGRRADQVAPPAHPGRRNCAAARVEPGRRLAVPGKIS
jgi:hypothetical protein